MNCIDTLSCTFLDLFLYIVDKKHCNKIYYSEYQINPNRYLKISRTSSGKFVIKFTQTTIDNSSYFYALDDKDYRLFRHHLPPKQWW